MRRRDFLLSAAAAPAAQSSQFVMSVRGRIDPARMGVTLPHEHFFSTFGAEAAGGNSGTDGTYSGHHLAIRPVRPRVLPEGQSSQSERFVVVEIPVNVGRVVRTHKYVTYAGDPVEQLYDLQADPGETNNLARASSYVSILAGHRKILRDWEARLGPAPANPHGDWWRKFGAA